MLFIRALTFRIVLLQVLLSGICLAETPVETGITASHPLYVGVIGGYGATTWAGLAHVPESEFDALASSLPVEADEGGGVWGFAAGYEFSPYFALEVNYMRYPDAKILFDSVLSTFSIRHDGDTQFTTKTDTIGFMGRVMVYIPHTHGVRFYTGVGGAGVHRADIVIDGWHLSPAFGVGFTYNFTDYLMGEIGGNYTAGYGKSDLEPEEFYYPFLYSGFVKLALRF